MKNYLHLETQRQYDTIYSSALERKTELDFANIENGIVIPFDDSSKEWTGGVYNKDRMMVPFSQSILYNPKFNRRVIRTGNNIAFVSPKKRIEETVVYAGDLDPFYGHFLTNSLSRLWFLLDSQFSNLKVCYIAKNRNSDFLDAYRLFGIREENLIFINEPTEFKDIIVPEPSFRYFDYWHKDFKRTIDRIRQNITSKFNYEKIYVSRSSYFGASGTFGELPIEKIFRRAGYKIIHPEKYSFRKQLEIFHNCKNLAGLSGTAMHNALFCSDGIECININRSNCIMPVQIMIDQMKNLSSSYIDAYINPLPVGDCAYPYLVGLTPQLEAFFTDNNFLFKKQYFYKTIGKDLYNFIYYWPQSYNSTGVSEPINNKLKSEYSLVSFSENIKYQFSNYIPLSTSQNRYSIKNFVNKIKQFLIFILKRILPKKIYMYLKSIKLEKTKCQNTH